MGEAAHVQPEAERDIEAAALWYENKRKGLGVRFVTELNHLFERIAEHPKQFPIVDEPVRRALLHRFPYAVYFLDEPGSPTVLAVLHQHRSPDVWRSRE